MGPSTGYWYSHFGNFNECGTPCTVCPSEYRYEPVLKGIPVCQNIRSLSQSAPFRLSLQPVANVESLVSVSTFFNRSVM